MLKEERKKIISHLHDNNGYEYNLRKAAEECQELALVLIQKLNKPTKVDDQAIIEEIGDVKIRIKILSKMFSKEKIKERVIFKLSKFKGYIDNKEYSKI